MSGVIVSLLIMSMWVLVLTMHTRRLLRLAHLRAPGPWRTVQLRQQVARVWWWLGRAEFWRGVLVDCWRCTQLTVMLLLLLWGASP